MTAKKIKQTGVDRNKYKIYMKKASEFYQSMTRAEESQNWNAVGLNSVHCAISACDAVGGSFPSRSALGIRSAQGCDRIAGQHPGARSG